MPYRSLLLATSFCLFGVANSDAKEAKEEVPRNQTVHQYIQRYAATAMREMDRTGIPASITLAQAIAESSFGNSPLAYEANNHFGIKCGNTWSGASYMRKDDDFDQKGELTESCFRSYETVDESFRDHSNFLRGKDRYKFLFSLDKADYKGWALGLKTAGYATLPTYSDILISNIEHYNLTEYDKKSPVVQQPISEQLAAAEGIFINSLDLTTIEETDVKGVLMRNHLKMVIATATDTPEQLALTYNIAPDVLRKYNDLSETDKLIPFQFVYLEPKRHWYKQAREIHTVQANENIYLIAQFYGVKMSYLRSHNGLELGEEPAEGAVIYLKRESLTKPALRKTAVKTASITQKPSQPKPFGTIENAVTNQ